MIWKKHKKLLNQRGSIMYSGDAITKFAVVDKQMKHLTELISLFVMLTITQYLTDLEDRWGDWTKIWPPNPDNGRRTVGEQTFLARRPDMVLIHIHTWHYYAGSCRTTALSIRKMQNLQQTLAMGQYSLFWCQISAWWWRQNVHALIWKGRRINK